MLAILEYLFILYKTSPLERLRRDLQKRILEAAEKAFNTVVDMEDDSGTSDEAENSSRFQLGFVGRVANWFLLRFDTRYIDATSLVVFPIVFILVNVWYWSRFSA